MKFSIIYEVECAMSASIRQWAPPESLRKSFTLTERGDGEPSDWCSDLWDGKCKHRKWAGILTKDQFKKFLDFTYLKAEYTETMGSIGAPGVGFGWAPAISFRGDDEHSIQSAYVTPLPDVAPDTSCECPRCLEGLARRAAHNWDRIRRAVLSMWG